MKKYTTLIIIFFNFIIYSKIYAYSSKDLIYYSKDFYGEDTKVIAPNIDYPVNSEALDEATISAVQLVSINDLAKSFYSYSVEETQKRDWAQAIYRSYTLVDWRGFNATQQSNVDFIYKLPEPNGTWGLQTQFNVDDETKRAIAILGNRAYLPEGIDFSTRKAWISLDIDKDKYCNKTEALIAIYKAIGVEHFLPALIGLGNLDGQEELDGDKKELKYTSLMSLPDASRFSYYSVWARDAMHYIYQAPNLVEGYLWEALQDGIISPYHLKEEANKKIKQFIDGKFSNPIKEGDSLASINSQENDLKNRFTIGYAIGSDNNRKLVCKFCKPEAFVDESIMLVDFLSYVTKVMNIQGEPVLTKAEQQTLASAYGSYLPSSMSAEYYNTILYLVARGIIDDTYTPEMLYQSLTYKDMYIILSRVADKNSRLTFKYVTVPYDLQMTEDGFMSVAPVITEINPEDIITPEIKNSYDIRIKKTDDTIFLDKNGKEATPYISKLSKTKEPAYGVLMSLDDSGYYWFRIYTNTPVPKDYENLDNPLVLYSDNSTKVLKLENTRQSGYYEYNNEKQMCILNYTNVTTKMLKNMKGVGTIELTSGDDVELETSEAEIIPYTFTLKKGVDLDSLIINGKTRSEWIKSGDENSSEEVEDKVVYTDAIDEKGTTFTIYIKTNNPDNPDAIIASKIAYRDKALPANNIAYVKRNNSRDVYYSVDFLHEELNISILYIDDNNYKLKLPGEEIFISHSEDNGWLCFTSKSILQFGDEIRPVRHRKAEDNTDIYLVHGLLIEHYLRSHYNKGWSTFIGTDGILHISTNDSSIELEAVKADVYNVLTPTVYTMDNSSTNVLFQDKKSKKFYLDIAAVPSNLSNCIAYWRVSSQSEVTAYVISLVPVVGDKFTNNYKPLEELLKKTNITITQTDRFNIQYIQATKFDETVDSKNVNNENLVYKKFNDVKYDSESFILLYEVPISFNIDLDKLPYVYDSNGHVFFVNLPLTSDLKYYKDDIEFALFPKELSSSIYDAILSKAQEGSTQDTHYWYPVVPISDLFIETNDAKSSNYRQYKLNDNDIIIAGPYQVNPKVSNSNKIKFALNNVDLLPKWACNIYGSDDFLTNASLAYKIDIGSKRVFLPAKNTLAFYETENSKIDTNENPVSLKATFKKSLNDIKDEILSAEKSLTQQLKQADTFVTAIYLFIIAVIPRILIFSLLVVEILSLTSKYKFVQWFCKEIIDPFYVLSFGRIRCYQIKPLRIWVCCSVGIIIIVLISREYGTQILIKLLTVLLEELM